MREPSPLPKQGTASDGGQKNPSGQIVPTIGNSLIQTVANSSTIWRGAVVGTFPISFGPQHIPRGTPSEFHPTPPRSPGLWGIWRHVAFWLKPTRIEDDGLAVSNLASS